MYNAVHRIVRELVDLVWMRLLPPLILLLSCNPFLWSGHPPSSSRCSLGRLERIEGPSKYSC